MVNYVARVGWPTPGVAWYVRPAGTTYGEGDGTSYADAWAGFSAIQWASVDPGDVVFVAGTHSVPNSGYNGSEVFNVGASGVSGSPIIIASCETSYGASTDDAGTIWGARYWSTSGWSGPTNGVYSRALTSIVAMVNPFGVEEDGNVLHVAATLAECESTAGSLYAPQLTSTIYYHPSDALQGLYYYGSYAIGLEGRSHVTARGLTLKYGGASRGVVMMHNETVAYTVAGLVVEDCTLSHGQHRAIHLRGPHFADIAMRDCVVYDCAAGFYPVNNWGTENRDATNVVVERNEFYHTAQIAKRTAFKDSWGDELAIGIQGGADYFIVQDNYIHDWHGMGINLWLGTTRSMDDCQIVRNRIFMDSSEAGRANGGIIYSGMNAANFSNRAPRTLIANNLIVGCAYGAVDVSDYTWNAAVRIKNDAPTDPEDTLRIENNTIVDCYHGVYATAHTATLPLGATIQNNIIVDPNNGGYFINHGDDSDQSGITVNYNCYHGTGKWRWDGGADITSLATWQSTTGEDANSFTDDPLFVSASDYSLQSGSPCVNTGTNTGLTDDLSGNPRPVGVYDIGAYERQ